MSRKQFFKYPSSMREMLRQRPAIPLATNDIADQLLYLSRNPELSGILSYDDQPRLVPGQYRDDNAFFKHGPSVRMRAYGSMEEANKDHVPFWIQREEAFARFKDDECPSGISWSGLGRDGRPRRYTLVECVEAARLLSRSLSSLAKEDAIGLNPGRYGPANSRDPEGAAYIVRMHSRSQDFFYPSFRISNVAIKQDGSEYGVSHKLDTNHNCGKETNRETHSQDPGSQSMYPIFFCAHSIAAYWAVARAEMKNRNETPMAMNPFAMPTKKVLDAYTAARYSAMVWEPYVDDFGKERHRHRPLHEAELEVMLFSMEKQYRHEQPFFATRKDDYRCYDWKRLAR